MFVLKIKNLSFILGTFVFSKIAVFPRENPSCLKLAFFQSLLGGKFEIRLVDSSYKLKLQVRYKILKKKLEKSKM